MNTRIKLSPKAKQILVDLDKLIDEKKLTLHNLDETSAVPVRDLTAWLIEQKSKFLQESTKGEETK